MILTTLYLLRRDLKFSDKMYETVDDLAQNVSQILDADVGRLYELFPYTPTDIKTFYADYITDIFTEHAQGSIWQGLKKPEIYLAPSFRNTAAAAISKRTYEGRMDVFEAEKVSHDTFIAVGPGALNKDAVEYSSIIFHECIHDTFNQMMSEIFKKDSTFDPLEKGLGYDIAIALAARGISAKLSHFSLLYLTDFEEELCRHGQRSLEKDLQRFQPRFQLTYDQK